MKKVLTFSLFLVLGFLQASEAQSRLSQFSLPSAKQKVAQQAREKALAAARTVALPGRAALAHANTAKSITGARSRQIRPNLLNPPVNPVGFVTAGQIPAGGGTFWTAVSADFNGDGKADFAMPVLNDDDSTYSISVVLSNGDGTFQSPILIPNVNGTGSDGLLTGDFNKDGKQDLILVHSSNPATFEAWLGNGDGTFNVQGNTLNQIAPYSLVGGVIALDASGNLDVIVIDGQSPANVWTVAGNGDGTFSQTPAAVPLTGGSLGDVVFADFNGDGLLDFAASDANSNYQTVVYLRQNNGTYVAGAPLATALGQYGPCNNTAGDLTGDGKPEIVTSNCNYNNLIVYVNNGDGTFQPGVYYNDGANSAALYPEAVTIADVNGDGKNDIVSTNYEGDITILLGNGDGTVTVPSVGYSTGGFPRTSALVADFNGDGHPDVIVPDNEYSFVYLQGYGDGTFRAALDYFSPIPDTLQAYGWTVAAGDFNGDGLPDFVVGECCDLTVGVTLYLSKSDGTLMPGVNYGAGGGLEGVVVADFDGDKNLDVAAVDYNNNNAGDVQIFYGKGDGTFAPTVPSFPTGSNGSWFLVTGDFNKDGHPDLAVLNSNNSNISVLLNDGAGGFLPPVTYADTANGQDIAVADVNGDGILDLVVSQNNLGVDVFLGNADGTFQNASAVGLGLSSLGNLALADLDGDGKIDLVVVVDDWSIGTGVAVAKGNGDGTFQPPAFFATTTQSLNLNEPYPGDVKIVDLKGNGKLDIVYTNTDFGTVGFLYNTGTNPFAAGMFYDPVEYAGGADVYSIALADINQDGAVDVVLANDNFAGATVMLNASGSGSALGSSLNPAPLRQSVTFTANVTAKVHGVTAVPTGTVGFFDGSTSIGTATISGGIATFSTGGLALGNHTITAQYTGDANFLSSASTLLSQVVTAPPDFTLGAGNQQSVTVTAGDSAHYTFSVTSSNYNQLVTFTCVSASLPSKTACSFSPASLTPSGAGPTTTLTISTTAPTTSSLTMPDRPNSNPIVPTLWASLSSVGLFGLVLAGSGKKRSRRHMFVVMGILLLVMTFALVGCGGSSSTSTTHVTTAGTPAGSYNVTVTATGSGTGAPTHSMNVTLIVQ